MKQNLAILFGGKSSEYEVSLSSAFALLENINKEKYNIFKIGITKEGRWYLFEGSNEMIRDGSWCADEKALAKVIVSPDNPSKTIIFKKPDGDASHVVLDAVFPILHGRFGEDGKIQGLLSVCGIPVVGCGCTSSAVCMDKALTKSIINEYGIVRQAKAVIAKKSDGKTTDEILSEAEKKIGYPMFIKPASSGSSVGCSLVKTKEDFLPAVKKAFSEDFKIMIEECITGRETEVAVLEENGKYTVSLPAEIDVGSSEFYDYETKYVSDVSSYYIPARIPDEKIAEIRNKAELIFRALDCRGISRVDFFYTESGEIVFNEINTLPGFTPISMYPKLMNHAGIPYDELIDRLIEGASVL